MARHRPISIGLKQPIKMLMLILTASDRNGRKRPSARCSATLRDGVRSITIAHWSMDEGLCTAIVVEAMSRPCHRLQRCCWHRAQSMWADSLLLALALAMRATSERAMGLVSRRAVPGNPICFTPRAGQGDPVWVGRFCDLSGTNRERVWFDLCHTPLDNGEGGRAWEVVPGDARQTLLNALAGSAFRFTDSFATGLPKRMNTARLPQGPEHAVVIGYMTCPLDWRCAQAIDPDGDAHIVCELADDDGGGRRDRRPDGRGLLLPDASSAGGYRAYAATDNVMILRDGDLDIDVVDDPGPSGAGGSDSDDAERAHLRHLKTDVRLPLDVPHGSLSAVLQTDAAVPLDWSIATLTATPQSSRGAPSASSKHEALCTSAELDVAACFPTETHAYRAGDKVTFHLALDLVALADAHIGEVSLLYSFVQWPAKQIP